jgi:hypothetical protein
MRREPFAELRHDLSGPAPPTVDPANQDVQRSVPRRTRVRRVGNRAVGSAQMDNHAYLPNVRKPVRDSVFAVVRARGEASL